MHVTLYRKSPCKDCDVMLATLQRVAPLYNVALRQIDIEQAGLDAELGSLVPVVQVDDLNIGRLVQPITERELYEYLNHAFTILEPPSPDAPRPGGVTSTLDRFTSAVGRHWLRIALIGLGIFITLPWLAPIFAALGWWGMADPIYTAYAFQCHQLPERSAHIFGYEVCQCWRCNALYGGMFVLALLYGLSRDRPLPALRWLRKPLPTWAFALLLLPILVDGLSHMLGYRDGFDPNLAPAFGTFFVGDQVFSLNWILRIITGLCAAFASIWFSFPRMQKAVEDSEALRQLYAQRWRRASASRVA